MREIRRRLPIILALFLSMSALVGCAPEDTERAQGISPERVELLESAAIYGADDRTEVYAHSNIILKNLASDSSVAVIYPWELDLDNSNDIIPYGITLGDYIGLCPTERFVDQPTAAHCSATLIDDDLVLTAGHCVETLSDCQDQFYVFNYYYESPDQLATMTIEDIFECAQIVVRSDTPDYAIIQLDRPAAPRFSVASVKVGDGPMAEGESVGIIGYGSGIPAKIDNGGAVTDPRSFALDNFRATTDSFGGNSGSGVFNATGEVVGILVAGANDYTWSSAGCMVTETYPDSGSNDAEVVVYIQRAIEALCNSGWESPRLCPESPPEGSWCQSCQTSADCTSGWSCHTWSDTPDVSWCSKPCSNDGDCQSNHLCNIEGDCVPSRDLGCSNGDVWTVDGCGNALVEEAECGALSCSGGACVDCDDECDLNSTQCSGSNAEQTCTLGAEGCAVWGPSNNCAGRDFCTNGGCTQTPETPAAWCQSCDAQNPCPNDWSCFEWSNTGITWCSQQCDSDAQCRDDHSCNGGVCTPQVFPTCNLHISWDADVCNNFIQEREVCFGGCSEGVCGTICSENCTLGERRCNGLESYIVCVEGDDGCPIWKEDSCNNSDCDELCKDILTDDVSEGIPLSGAEVREQVSKRVPEDCSCQTRREQPFSPTLPGLLALIGGFFTLVWRRRST